ncbi:hypothetical protein TIFTF001_027899 [Ficus carica]|uniref:Uncharacterized protein n=1 Tax=Ficus carica TaxID=3494 RepID=A0AA88DNV0_FICCA|nr:hypothetical protein TIFTF001_027899 [Ficus carica]
MQISCELKLPSLKEFNPETSFPGGLLDLRRRAGVSRLHFLTQHDLGPTELGVVRTGQDLDNATSIRRGGDLLISRSPLAVFSS